jgi:hypothetical protein
LKCFICERDEKRVLLVRLPVETAYEDDIIEIIGNFEPNEYICLPCLGFQFDLCEREREFKKIG